MAGKNTAVFGIYPAYASAETALDDLKAAGFRDTDSLGTLPGECWVSKDLAHAKATKAPEGAVAGAATGSSRWVAG
jgi:hypothetical protein